MRELVSRPVSRLGIALTIAFAVALMSFAVTQIAYAAQGFPLYSWGNNNDGRLGQGNTLNLNEPTRMGEADNWVQVSTASSGSWAINAEGHLYGWGALWTQPQMGQGDIPGSGAVTSPTRIGTADNWVSVGGRSSDVVALNADGELFAWGSAGGIGQGANVPTPTGVGQTWQTFEMHPNFIIAQNVQGYLYSWGTGHSDSLGVGASSTPLVPMRIGNNSDWVHFTVAGNSVLAISESGHLYSWGNNAEGQLGLGDNINRNVPHRVGTADNWTKVVGTAASLGAVAALNSDGELWTWGSNNNGQLGTGAGGSRNVPARVGDGSNWVFLSAANSHFLAANSNLELFSWGNNASGQLGLGTTGGHENEPRFVLQSYGFSGASRGGGHTSFMLMRTTPIPLPLTKTLQKPQGTDLPGTNPLTFDFLFTPATIPTDSTWLPGPTIPASGGIPANTVRVALDSTTTTHTAGTTTIQGEIDLWDALNHTPSLFPHAGVFVWNIEEITNSSSVNSANTGHTMTYATNRFQLLVEVDVTLNIREIVIHHLNEDSTRGDKADNLEFINTLTYIPLTGSPANLTVTKQVTGDRANLTQLFDFTLTLTPHILAPLPETITTRIVGPGDITVDRPVTRTGNVFTFSLLYSERLELFYLPAGTSFAVTEAAVQSFLPSVRTYSGGILVHSQTGTTNTSLTANHIDQRVAESGRNAADFTNAHQHVPITGLSIAGISILVIVVLITFFALALIARSRRRSIEYLAVH